MALFQLSLPSLFCGFNSRHPQQLHSQSTFCIFSRRSNETTVTSVTMAPDNTVVRRSANYQPPIWKHEFLLSLKSEFTEERYLKPMEELRKTVKIMLDKKMGEEDSLEQLELIDTLQRLGLSYHFEEDINQILSHLNQKFHERDNKAWKKNNNLYATALEFRILRQHGHFIPQDVFSDFKDEMENVSKYVCEDKAKAMLSLYEASYLAIEGEGLLDEVRHFAVKHLEKYMKHSNNNEEIISSMVSHALELPLHWRMPRLQTRWFIDIYQRKPDMNPILLEFAKLDFNYVQSIHQQELKQVSSWWRSTGLGEKLEFARDRLMANFTWTVGLGCEPQLGHFREMMTKITSLITIIDDVYDVYGTLDELQRFTNAVERWDVEAIDMLPDYMKICFFALHNTINDIAFDILRDQGVNVIPYLKKMWADLCQTFLIEAKWSNNNYRPSFQEYLENAWVSVSGSLILFHAFVFVMRPITKEALESWKEYPHVVKYSSIIFRITNDLATSSDEMERGDVVKSLECYMNDTNVSEDEARNHLNHLIMESWKKMNGVGVSNSSYFSKDLIQIGLNLARISHTTYQHRDGHTVENHETKDRVLSLFIRPI